MAFLSLVLVSLLALSQDVVQQRPNGFSGAGTEITRELESPLLESGNYGKIRQIGTINEVKIISYNIRYRSGTELSKLVKLLREDAEIGNATVIGLQEVDRRKKRSGNANTARIIAEALELNYAWAAPPTAKANQEEETGVAILSMYPLSDVRRIVLPHKGPDQRRRVGVGATITISDTEVRVYSLHGETRISVDKRIEQLDAVLQDLKGFPTDMPAIVLGDFNTWQPGADDKTIKLFSGAGFHTPFGGHSTFRARALFIPIEMRLDWVWVRGIDVVTFGIDRKIELSDHWPLWANVRLAATKAAAASQR
jgi:endonuclease/exonuclease/phosphatase family metal-dependent hydrolase